MEQLHHHGRFNKSDIANFLSEMIMQKGEDLPERWELVTGGDFLALLMLNQQEGKQCTYAVTMRRLI